MNISSEHAIVMQYHDAADVLRRWCNNYTLDKNFYLGVYEWITIELQGRYWVGTIGEDDSQQRRTVKFEVNAPAPPTFFQPSKEKRPKPVPRIHDPRVAPGSHHEIQHRLREAGYKFAQIDEMMHRWSRDQIAHILETLADMEREKRRPRYYGVMRTREARYIKSYDDIPDAGPMVYVPPKFTGRNQ